jgi:capsular polysaccharide biosynthesis protein
LDFWELLSILSRRWVVVVPLVVLTAFAALFAPRTVDPTYDATSSAILVGPSAGESWQKSNPFLNVGLATTAAALVVAADAPATRKAVGEAGNASDYKVAQAASRSPIVKVQASADTPKIAVATVNQVIDIMSRQLAQSQDAVEAPRNSRLTMQRLTPEILPAPVYDGATRVRLVALAVGLGVTITLALVLDGLARRRNLLGVRGKSSMRDVSMLSVEERLDLLAARIELLDERDRIMRYRDGSTAPPHVDPAGPTADTPAGDGLGADDGDQWRRSAVQPGPRR